jgi:hypothetical protein
MTILNWLAVNLGLFCINYISGIVCGIIIVYLQIKNDVETQGDFIRYLIKEVEGAAFTDIEDVVPFVKWLDDELSYLVLFHLLIYLH